MKHIDRLSRHFLAVLLLGALVFGVSSTAFSQTQEQVITFTTSRAVGDSIRLKVVSTDGTPISVEGLSSPVLEEDWKRYAITSQTIVIKGPVRYLANFKNGVKSLVCENALSLDRIDCEENELTELNLDAAPYISQLFCHKNQLTKIDISECSLLNWFNCSENNLQEVDITNKDLLSIFVCADNQLTTLNTTGAPALGNLDCSRNQLTELDLSSNTMLKGLECQENPLSSLTLTGCNRLKTIYCFSNKLTSLDLSTLTSLKDLRCFDNQLTALDFSANPDLGKVYMEINAIDEPSMEKLMASLPKSAVVAPDSAVIGVIDVVSALEKNVCNKKAVQLANEKDWSVLGYTGTRYTLYPGTENTAIDHPTTPNKPMIYPTVAQDRLYLTTPVGQQEATIYTLQGLMVLRVQASSEPIDISMLPAGDYLFSYNGTSCKFSIRR